MKEPVHKIKRRVKFAHSDGKADYWSTDERQGWLGSGVLDKNGVEIYEGDIVILDGQRGVVRFDNAKFYIDRNTAPASDDPEDEVVPFNLNCLCSPFIRIVGHIAEEMNHD